LTDVIVLIYRCLFYVRTISVKQSTFISAIIYKTDLIRLTV